MRKPQNVKKDLAFSTTKNSMCKSNSSAKENTNVEGKSQKWKWNTRWIAEMWKFRRFFIQYTKHHFNKIIMAHININSCRNIFDMLTNGVSEYIDILMISETKLHGKFPHALYLLNDFSNPYRLDRNSHGGGILIYVRDDTLI